MGHLAREQLERRGVPRPAREGLVDRGERRIILLAVDELNLSDRQPHVGGLRAIRAREIGGFLGETQDVLRPIVAVRIQLSKYAPSRRVVRAVRENRLDRGARLIMKLRSREHCVRDAAEPIEQIGGAPPDGQLLEQGGVGLIETPLRQVHVGQHGVHARLCGIGALRQAQCRQRLLLAAEMIAVNRRHLDEAFDLLLRIGGACELLLVDVNAALVLAACHVNLSQAGECLHIRRQELKSASQVALGALSARQLAHTHVCRAAQQAHSDRQGGAQRMVLVNAEQLFPSALSRIRRSDRVDRDGITGLLGE